jgi:hypothetical protein
MMNQREFQYDQNRTELSYGGRNEPMSIGGTNNYALTLFRAGEVGGIKVPSYGIESTTTKKILITQDVTVPSTAGGSSPEFLILSFPHNVKNSGKIFIRWVQIGIVDWIFYSDLNYSEDLSSGYSLGRTVSSVLAVSGSTIATGFAPLQGNVDAIVYTALWNLFDTTITSILPQAVNEKNIVANAQLSEGAVGLGFPIYEPELKSTTGTVIEQVYSNHILQGTTAINTVAGPGTITITPRSMVYGTFRLEITVRWNVTIVGPTLPVMTVAYGGTIFNTVTNTAQQVTRATLSVGNPSSLAGLSVTTYSNVQNQTGAGFPISSFVVNVSGTSTANVSFDFGVFALEDNNPGYLAPGNAFHIRNPVPNSIMLLGGAINYEVIPNIALSRDIKTSTGNSLLDMKDLKVVKRLLSRQSGPSAVKMVYPRSVYADLCNQGFFENMCHRENLNTALNTSGGWSVLGDVVGAGLGFTPYAAYAPLAQAAGRFMDGNNGSGTQVIPRRRQRGNLSGGNATLTPAAVLTVETVGKHILDLAGEIGWGQLRVDETLEPMLKMGRGFYCKNAFLLKAAWDDYLAKGLPIASFSNNTVNAAGIFQGITRYIMSYGSIGDCIINNGLITPTAPLAWPVTATMWYKPTSLWSVVELITPNDDGDYEVCNLGCNCTFCNGTLYTVDGDWKTMVSVEDNPISFENTPAQLWYYECPTGFSFSAPLPVAQALGNACAGFSFALNNGPTVSVDYDATVVSTEEVIPEGVWGNAARSYKDPNLDVKLKNIFRGMNGGFYNGFNVAKGVTVSPNGVANTVNVFVSDVPLESFDYITLRTRDSDMLPDDLSYEIFIRVQNAEDPTKPNLTPATVKSLQAFYASLHIAMVVSQRQDPVFITLFMGFENKFDEVFFEGDSLGLALLLALMNAPYGPVVTGAVAMDGNILGVDLVETKYKRFKDMMPFVYPAGSVQIEKAVKPSQFLLGNFQRATEYTKQGVALSDEVPIYEVTNFSNALFAVIGGAQVAAKVGSESASSNSEVRDKSIKAKQAVGLGLAKTIPMTTRPERKPKAAKEAVSKEVKSPWYGTKFAVSRAGKSVGMLFDDLVEADEDFAKDFFAAFPVRTKADKSAYMPAAVKMVNAKFGSSNGKRYPPTKAVSAYNRGLMLLDSDYVQADQDVFGDLEIYVPEMGEYVNTVDQVRNNEENTAVINAAAYINKVWENFLINRETSKDYNIIRKMTPGAAATTTTVRKPGIKGKRTQPAPSVKTITPNVVQTSTITQQQQLPDDELDFDAFA